MAASPLDQTDLFEVTKQLSKDQDAYSTLNGGLNHAMVSDIHDDGRSNSAESLTRAGRTVGFLEEARIQAEGDPETAEFKAKPLVDEAISYIPVVSDKVQQGFDYAVDQWLADEQQRLDEQQTEENIEAYTTRNRQLIALAAEWRDTHAPTGQGDIEAQKEITEAAEAGIGHAQGVSGKQPS
jgi:hypothetical protein